MGEGGGSLELWQAVLALTQVTGARPWSRSCLPLWDCDGEILTGKKVELDFVAKEVAGTLSPFKCGGEPFQRTVFPAQKLEAGRLGLMEGQGMLVETNQAKVSSHMVTTLHWAEDKEDEGRNPWN